MLNYERCRVTNSGESIITIEGEQVVGMGVTSYRSSTLNSAKMIFPTPIQDALTTIIGSECDTRWELVGHTNMEIRGDQIKPGCDIAALGNQTDSILTVDFGLETIGENCAQGYEIEVDEGQMVINGATLTYGSPFKDIILIMSACNDIVHIKKTFKDSSLIDINTGGGNDTIIIGVENTGFEDQISSNLVVDAGNGMDYLLIYDEGSEPKDIDVKFNLLRGLDGADYRNSTNFTDIFYFNVEQFSMNLGTSDNVVHVSSTGQDSTVNITSQGGADFINVTSTQGSLNLHTGSGNDNVTVHTTANFTSLFVDAGDDEDWIQVYGLGYGADATVHGGSDNDVLYVDPRSSEGEGRNKMNGTILSWDGGHGNDGLEMFFVSTGFTNLNVFGDNQDTNEIIVHCPDVVCTVLSRDTFLANIHDPGNPIGSLERLNIDKASSEISSLLLFLHEGNNR